MKNLTLSIAAISSFVSGCQSTASSYSGGDRNDLKTHGERNSNYTYVPIDPISINFKSGQACQGVSFDTLIGDEISDPNDYDSALIELPIALPDNTTRVAFREFDLNGNMSLGPVGGTTKNNRYQIIIDYINSDTIDITFIAKRKINRLSKQPNEPNEKTFPVNVNIDYSVFDRSTEKISIERTSLNDVTEQSEKEFLIHVPVYVGVGLRIIADVKASSKAN